VQGRPILRSRYEAVADRSAGFVLGDQFKIGRDTFTVVGLTQNLVGSGGDPVVYVTLRDAQRLQFLLTPAATRRETARATSSAQSTDTINAVLVRLLPGIDPKEFAEAVKRWKHLSALTAEEQEIVLSRSVVERARRQIGLFTTLLLVVSTVIIALIIYTMTLDKKKSIATLKLIGASDRRIVGMILQQALALGLISFFVGLSLIHLVHGYFPRRLVLEAPDSTALFGAVLIVCLLASAWGVRTALKIDPAAALAG
jgi:putative ABC transport system permease protein